MKILSIWCVLGVLFILFVLCDKQDLYESFSSNTKIILLGDSIFQNELFVPQKKSVGALLKAQYGSKKVKIYAEDGAMIEDMKTQLLVVDKKYNKKSTHIFLSFGGNDIIENFIEYYTGVTLKQLFKDYKNNISKLQLQFPNANIHLSTIYYPKKEPYTYYHDTIKSWNDMIISYAKNRGFNVLRIDKYFKKKKDFTQSIEPSINGSKIILNTIQENLD